MGNRAGGWFGLSCWNGLSGEQQTRLIQWGNLPFGFTAEGGCPFGAEVAIEMEHDEAPGPRFYCRACAAMALLDSLECDLVDIDRTREQRYALGHVQAAQRALHAGRACLCLHTERAKEIP